VKFKKLRGLSLSASQKPQHRISTLTFSPFPMVLMQTKYISKLFISGLSQAPDSPPVIMYVSSRNGLPEEEITWAKMLRNFGYRTAAVGKK